MEYAVILANQVLIMFLLIVLGYVLYKIKFISAETNKQLTNIVLMVVVSAMVINSFQIEYDAEKTKNMLLGFLLSAISIVIAIGISHIVRLRGKRESLATERFSIIFTNCGFMAIPLMDALFGQIGVFYCNTYLTMFNLFVWTYGVALMEPKKENKANKSIKERIKPFLSPTIFSIVLGFLLYLFEIKLPSPVGKAIEYVSSMNTPLAMIVSGVYIAQSNLLGAIKNIRVYAIVMIKSFLIPLVVLFIFKFLPFDNILMISILIAAACPTAATSMLFANRYDGDVERASNIFTISTLMSLISLPVIILIATKIL